MADASTAKFEELVIEVEKVPASGTYAILAGMIDWQINRNSNVDTQEVPDATDESQPLSIERQVRSQEVTITGTGVWALEDHQDIHDWWYAGTTLNVRVRNAYVDSNGTSGDPIHEAGPAILVRMNNQKTKGAKVSAELEIQFDGLPTITDVV